MITLGMTDKAKEQAAAIKRRMEWNLEVAEKIMCGGENYDGADGARYILELCSDIEFLLKLVDRLDSVLSAKSECASCKKELCEHTAFYLADYTFCEECYEKLVGSLK